MAVHKSYRILRKICFPSKFNVLKVKHLSALAKQNPCVSCLNGQVPTRRKFHVSSKATHYY